MKTLIVALSLLSLTGCITASPPAIVDHQVLVTVPCKIKPPEKPEMPLTDDGLVSDDLFTKTKKALAEIELRKGYEGKLEAAVGSCQ